MYEINFRICSNSVNELYLFRESGESRLLLKFYRINYLKFKFPTFTIYGHREEALTIRFKKKKKKKKRIFNNYIYVGHLTIYM